MSVDALLPFASSHLLLAISVLRCSACVFLKCPTDAFLAGGSSATVCVACPAGTFYGSTGERKLRARRREREKEREREREGEGERERQRRRERGERERERERETEREKERD